MSLHIQVIRAWPRRHESVWVELPEGASVSDAVVAAGFTDDQHIRGYAIYGVSARADTPLSDGDRVELLRALAMDPKQARRRRASKAV